MTPERTADRLVVPAHIFFYGTLMRGFALRERSRVDHLIRFVGPGEIRGALFDLGPYPGAVEGEGTVRGEVYDILAPGPLLARVDAIEHYMPGAPTESEYRRCAVRARLDDGQVRDVWVYFYNRPLGTARALAGGDYRHHIAAP